MTLHWFVPCRRAAVTGPSSHYALIDAWCEQLERHADTLARWYDLSEDDFETGLAAVRAWQASFFPEGLEVHAARDGEVTLDAWDGHFRPRLWKGAHRVLLEAADGPSERGDTVFDPLYTEDPPLVLTDEREIANPEAPLLVGDVVEMPLFRFLEHAGRGEYGSHAFLPDGSYLLGTSLDASGEEHPPLHDNRTAMRFQVLLDCLVGSFAHPSPVHHHPRARSAAVSAAVPAVPDAEELAGLIAEVRELLARFAPGGQNVLHTAIERGMQLDGWSHVPAGVVSKLWEHSETDWKGHPPPRVFVWKVDERLDQLRGMKSPSEARRAEGEALQVVHEVAIEGAAGFVTDLAELVESDPRWGKYASVGRSFASLNDALEAAKAGVARICGPLCDDEHARMEVSALVKALRDKLAALEAYAAGERTEPSGADQGPRIHARGMIYAGVLWPAAWKRYYDGPDAWHYVTNGWCRHKQGEIPNALPYGAGLEALPKDLPVTPGSACSDTALLLTNYMIRNHGEAASKTWGRNGVGPSMRAADKGDYYAIQDAYEYLTPEQVAELAPRVTREEQLASLDGVLAEVTRLQQMTSGDAGFWLPPLASAQADAAWGEVVRSTRDGLVEHATKTTGGWRPPVYFLAKLSAGLKKHEGEAGALLRSLHDAFVGGARTFIRDLDALMERPDWASFESVGKHIPSECADSLATLRALSSAGFVGHYGGNHAAARAIGRALHYLQKALRDKRKKLEKLAADPSKIEDLVGGRVDMSAHLGDVNVVSLTSHEWCIVRLRGAERLMDEPELPRAGFLSAFDPLSGAPYVAPGGRGDGQLFVFEQGAKLKRVSHGERKIRFFGAAPFWFEPVPDNLFEILPAAHSVCFRNVGRDDSRALRGITRLRDAEAMQALSVPGAGLPMLVHPTTQPASTELRAARARAEARMVTHGLDLWASRSVPYPTMDEARDAYATWQEVAAARKRMGGAAL